MYKVMDFSLILDTSPPLGVIIGGAVAGVVGIAILVVIIIVLLKWRNK